MAKIKIKKGDLVEVITGRSQKNGGDRGKQGKVISVDVERQRVLVEGVRQVKRHTKVGTSGRGAKTGGIITQEAALHISNVHAGRPRDQEAHPGRVPHRDRRA